MDREKIKEFAIKYLVEKALSFIGLLLLASAPFFHKSKLLTKLNETFSSIALPVSVGLTGALILSLSYIVHLHLKNRLIFFGGLYWKRHNRTPYCPRCKEVENKLVHMKFRQTQGAEGHTLFYVSNEYACISCSHVAGACEHPLEYKAINKAYEKQGHS